MFDRSSRIVIGARALSSRERPGYVPSVSNWSSIAEFMTSLVGVEDVRPQCADVDAMAKRGEASALLELAIALERTGRSAGVERGPIQILFNHIGDALALHPSRENASAALALLGVKRTDSTYRPRQPNKDARRAASLLAHGQPPEVCFALAPTVSTSVGTEAMACWIQELVVRGVAVDAVDTVVSFWDLVRAAEHPLAHLPLALLSIEESFRGVPRPDPPGVVAPTSPLRINKRDEGQRAVPTIFQLERLATPLDLTAAVESWRDGSNGDLDGGVFRLDNRVDELRPDHLARLPLECVANARLIRADAITPRIAAYNLFAASASGGCYGRDHGAAYARRDLWRSLAALVGADAATDSVHQIERASDACRFYDVWIESDWMMLIWWDFALACLRDDGRTFALVVATDND